SGKKILAGNKAFDLYATYGLPFEITRDIAKEIGLDVDEADFLKAMDAHRIASGGGKAIGKMGGEDTEMYNHLAETLKEEGKLPEEGVKYDPYNNLEAEGEILALIVDGEVMDEAQVGDAVAVILPETGFYIEAGGQVGDTGVIVGEGWRVDVEAAQKPAAGLILHIGTVQEGNPKVGDSAIAKVDAIRRKDIMRNHTATHLLHAALRDILGEHARQAGSLVSADKLRFDFTHPEAVPPETLEKIEAYVNGKILENYKLNTEVKSLQEAMDSGATALFGEKYDNIVRNVLIGAPSTPSSAAGQTFSNELCGGTHVKETNDIGLFTITSEGSAAAGIRRIEAITGREAFKQFQERRKLLVEVAQKLNVSPPKVVEQAESLVESLNEMQKQVSALRENMASLQFSNVLNESQDIGDINVLTMHVRDADTNTLRQLADRFRNKHPKLGVLVLGTVVKDKPQMIAAVTDDLVSRGIKAGDLVKW
ncbi:MAG TPA: alanine--tRNA ligase, partial [Anaerolineales bacterium]|nr:alanine--tRNA ligase [Anaerolineales bacterium]